MTKKTDILASSDKSASTEGKPPADRLNKADELTIIYDLVHEIISLKGLDVLLLDIVKQVSKHLKVEIVSIMLFDKETESLTIRAAIGLESRIIESTRVRPGEGVAGWVMKEREPLLVKDISKDPRFAPSFFSYQYSTTSLICVPLVVKNTFLGVLNVNNKGDSAPLTLKDLHFCTIIASLAALAIENARLFRDTQLRADRLEQLNQELMEINERLVNLDQRRTRFLSAIAHELNTPLTSMKGLTDMLERVGFPSERFASFTGLIKGELKRLINLTSGLLDISRLYSKKIPINRRWVVAADLIHKLAVMMNADAEEKNIELILDLCDAELQVFLDPEKFMQVLINLMSNAIKYSDGGVVVLAVWTETPDLVCFSVKDQGIGIPEQDLPHVFEEFYRVSAHMNMGRKGTGLGLALVKSIVDAHDGSVAVESTPGTGTCFTIRLPQSCT